MGTDIHMYVERRESTDSPWVSADKWSDDKYSPGEKTVDHNDQLFTDRSYDTFAILAGVRNGRGFAGLKTGAGFVPISEPRGLPEDMSPELTKLMGEGIEHTPTWLTLADIQSYDWTQTSIKSGIVSLQGLAQYKLQGRPSSWSGGIGGPGIGIVDGAPLLDEITTLLEATTVPGHAGKPQSADWYDLYHGNEVATAAIIAYLAQRTGFERPHFQVSWEVTYADAAALFLWKVVPRLWRMGSPENVRLVFYFDS